MILDSHIELKLVEHVNILEQPNKDIILKLHNFCFVISNQFIRNKYE